jgi:hypothetical protein
VAQLGIRCISLRRSGPVGYEVAQLGIGGGSVGYMIDPIAIG